MTAWCLVYVSVTFTVMQDGTSFNSGGTTQKSNVTRTSHVTYPDPATTRIRPGSNDRVPGSGTRRNSLPIPPLFFSQSFINDCDGMYGVLGNLLHAALLTVEFTAEW